MCCIMFLNLLYVVQFFHYSNSSSFIFLFDNGPGIAFEVADSIMFHLAKTVWQMMLPANYLSLSPVPDALDAEIQFFVQIFRGVMQSSSVSRDKKRLSICWCTAICHVVETETLVGTPTLWFLFFFWSWLLMDWRWLKKATRSQAIVPSVWVWWDRGIGLWNDWTLSLAHCESWQNTMWLFNFMEFLLWAVESWNG